MTNKCRSIEKLIQKAMILQVLCLFILSLNVIGAERLDISNFQLQGIHDWKIQRFYNETQYSTISLDGSIVVKAESMGTASALIQERDVDLARTPFLNWSWKINKIAKVLNERIKSGDDFSVRVYVIVKENIMIWRAKALNYVWSSNEAIGNSWSNPYSRSVKMIVLRSGNEESGKWVSEKRNIREDLKKMFGYDIQTINGIAIMTDTDNSKGSAIAYYGDLFFTAR